MSYNDKSTTLILPKLQFRTQVKSLHCESCDTLVSGSYTLPVLASLNQDDQKFILEFIKCSGSLKDMAQKMGLSYPTVRNLLDDIIEKVNKSENQFKQSKLI